MTKPLRRAHQRIFQLLAVILPAILFIGLWMRTS